MGEHAAQSHPAYAVLRQVTERASVLLARNPSAMTLEGTNTWVLRAPGGRECVVVDPGPAEAGHIGRILALGQISAILLTHHHPDHVRALPRLRRRLAAAGQAPAVLALSPSMVAKSQSGLLRLLPSGGRPRRGISAPFRGISAGRGIRGIEDGQSLELAGLRLSVLATPGHTSDSTSFLLHGGGGEVEAVLTGDAVLGRGSTVLDKNSGDLGDYLRSMRRLIAEGKGVVGLPGHGPELPDIAAAAESGARHREERLGQVRAALGRLGPKATSWQVVREVYPDVDAKLLPAALSSTRVQLEYLRREG